MLFRILLFLLSNIFFIILASLLFIELLSGNKKTKDKNTTVKNQIDSKIYWRRSKKHYAK